MPPRIRCGAPEFAETVFTGGTPTALKVRPAYIVTRQGCAHHVGLTYGPSCGQP